MQPNPRLRSYKCQCSCPCIVVLKFLPKFLWSTGNVEYMHSLFRIEYMHIGQKKGLNYFNIPQFAHLSPTHFMIWWISCKPLLWACYIRFFLKWSWVWKHKASKWNSRSPHPLLMFITGTVGPSHAIKRVKTWRFNFRFEAPTRHVPKHPSFACSTPCQVISIGNTGWNTNRLNRTTCKPIQTLCHLTRIWFIFCCVYINLYTFGGHH